MCSARSCLEIVSYGCIWKPPAPGADFGLQTRARPLWLQPRLVRVGSPGAHGGVPSGPALPWLRAQPCSKRVTCSRFSFRARQTQRPGLRLQGGKGSAGCGLGVEGEGLWAQVPTPRPAFIHFGCVS